MRARQKVYLDEIGGEPSAQEGRLIHQTVTHQREAIKLRFQAETARGKALLDLLRLAAEFDRLALLTERELTRVTKGRRTAERTARKAGPPQLNSEADGQPSANVTASISAFTSS